MTATQDLRQAALQAREALEKAKSRVYQLASALDHQAMLKMLPPAEHTWRDYDTITAALAALSVHLAAADSEGVSGSDVPARPTSLAGDARLPDDGFVWMTHPDHCEGRVIPVWTYMQHGTRHYVPFDAGATDYEWDLRSPEWALAASPPLPLEQGARMLTDDEIAECEPWPSNGATFTERVAKLSPYTKAVIAKFCEVNGIPVADPRQADKGENQA